LGLEIYETDTLFSLSKQVKSDKLDKYGNLITPIQISPLPTFSYLSVTLSSSSIFKSLRNGTTPKQLIPIFSSSILTPGMSNSTSPRNLLIRNPFILDLSEGSSNK